jgi:hypothetical protein
LTSNRFERFLLAEWGSGETVENDSRDHFTELDHRAKAAVLIRALRVSPLRERHNRLSFSVTFRASTVPTYKTCSSTDDNQNPEKAPDNNVRRLDAHM